MKIENILFKLKGELYKAKGQEWDDDEELYLNLEHREWKFLIEYIKKLESDLKMERELRDNALKMYDELLQGGGKE